MHVWVLGDMLDQTLSIPLMCVSLSDFVSLISLFLFPFTVNQKLVLECHQPHRRHLLQALETCHGFAPDNKVELAKLYSAKARIFLANGNSVSAFSDWVQATQVGSQLSLLVLACSFTHT